MSVATLRANLLSDWGNRGFSGRFRAACRSGLHFWRNNYARLHFLNTAMWRYGYPYPRYHAEASSSARGETRVIRGITLVPRYSGKNVKQAQKGYKVTQGNDLPLVLSGNTRRDILGGPFRTYGASTRIIRGSWGGSQICWAWLARVRLHGGLTTVIPEEAQGVYEHIKDMFSRFMADRGSGGGMNYRDEDLLALTGSIRSAYRDPKS